MKTRTLVKLNCFSFHSNAFSVALKNCFVAKLLLSFRTRPTSGELSQQMKWQTEQSQKKRRPFITFLLLLLLLLCFLFVLFSEVIRVFGFYFAFQGSFHFSFSTWLNHRKICSGSLCACHENLKENSSKNLLIKANNKIHFGERSKCSNLSAPSTCCRSRFAAELLCVRFFFFLNYSYKNL